MFLLAAAHLPPDDPHGGLGVAPGHAGLVLGLVHVGAPLADVPPAMRQFVRKENLQNRIKRFPDITKMFKQFQIPQPIARAG